MNLTAIKLEDFKKIIPSIEAVKRETTNWEKIFAICIS